MREEKQKWKRVILNHAPLALLLIGVAFLFISSFGQEALEQGNRWPWLFVGAAAASLLAATYIGVKKVEIGKLIGAGELADSQE